MRLEWRSRPFFYAALIFCAGILISDRPISHAISEERHALFLGGKIVSEVERRERPFGGESASFVLNVERRWEEMGAQGEPAKGRVRVSWNNVPIELEYGMVLVMQGELASFRGKSNPGGFDARAYWRSQKVDEAFFVSKKPMFKILSRAKTLDLKARMIAFKHFLSRRLDEDFEKWHAAFLKALFLGEKGGLDEDFKDLFIKTGTLHILAVSGFNIGFLTAVVWLFLRPFPIPRNGKLGFMLLCVWGYCALVGWQSPVVRASIMATVILAGRFSGRKADGLNLLGLSACVILAWNPRQLFDVGFQLSFLAVAALILFAPFFTQRPELLPYERWSTGEKLSFDVQELFWVSFICYFVTLPIVLWNFYILTPYALLANLLVVPLSFLIFFFGFVYFLTVGWVPKILFFVPFLMKTAMTLLVKSLLLIENIPGSVIAVGQPSLVTALFMAAGISYFLWEPRLKHRGVRFALVILTCLNILAAQEINRQLHRRFEMTMLDVGQGEAVYFEFPTGGNLLVDAGGARFSDQGRRAVTPFLRSKGVRQLDAVLISHPQEDHIGGLPTVLKEFHVRNVMHSDRPYSSHLWQNVQRELQRKKIKEWVLAKGMTVEGYPQIDISVLHPQMEPAHKNINDDSVVVRLKYGTTSVLMTGDIQTPGIHELLLDPESLHVDVLKVPHHGAQLTAEGAAFVGEVSPGFSLISAGQRNPFGHPKPATLAVLEAVPGNRILRTDRQGAIRLVSNGQRFDLDGPL